METTKNASCFMQEMTEKVNEVESQRKEREGQMVEITLKAIADRVVSKEQDIMALMSGNKSWQQGVREVVVKEILRAAEDNLWCPEYVEKLKSDQQVNVFSGTHWDRVEQQQWKDFVNLCAEKCGVPESQRMIPSFMKALYEGVAFNLAKNRKQRIPDDEVWMNMANGTLVVCQDGNITLREHRKEDLFFYTLNYVYDSMAECPLWHKFLDRVLPETESQQVLAEFIGYSLMKSHSLEKMLWFYGEGLNGKSVTLEIVEALLGARNVSFLSLCDLTNDDVKRAGIEHKMLNISHESGKEVNANVLKQLTSGERVLIKHLYMDLRETNDYGKFIAAFNALPRAELTFGYFRRLIILPYLVTIPAEEIDRQLTSKLKQELSGILNWVLKSIPQLMTRREFSSSESCEKALEQYRLQSDNVRLFANDQCEPSEKSTIASEIYAAYRNYCFGSSLKPIGKQKFYERLDGLGYERVTYANTVYFKLRVNVE
jgi:putative DNA primase/helicase